ncbi:MAG: hypothetical protein R2788_01030 [Saprospiraceae bacterium]
MQKTYLLFTFLVFVVTFFVSHNPFFWDTVQLASKHGHFFFENNFASIILPKEIDSGHVPAFGAYVAFCWKIFGKTLVVSHFATVPFLLGIGYFLLKIGAFLFGEKNAPWLLLLCFADPVLAGQSVLVSPDMVLVCFFLMGLYAVWVNKSDWLLLLAVIGLGMTSMRGMMVGVGLFVFSLVLSSARFRTLPTLLKKGALFLKKMAPFIPGGLIALAFLFYHWQQTGWIGHHPDSPWAPSFERVGVSGFVKNIAVLGWRMLDFGRVFECLLLLLLAKHFFQKDKRLGQLMMLAGIIFLVTILTQLLYKGLLAHRYFLPFFISLHLILFYLLFAMERPKYPFGISKKWLFGIAIIGFLSGNLWVYPKKISQGWDSTLAHLPWYGMIGRAQAYLTKEKIMFAEVGTAFPNIGPREWYELDGRMEGFKEKDFVKDCFILYSNIMNDFSDEEIDDLEENWSIIYEEKQMGVCLIVYKNPKQEICGN